jgi:hypothetical protein
MTRSGAMLRLFFGQEVLNKDPAVWLDGARPPISILSSNLTTSLVDWPFFVWEYTQGTR